MTLGEKGATGQGVGGLVIGKWRTVLLLLDRALRRKASNIAPVASPSR